MVFEARKPSWPWWNMDYKHHLNDTHFRWKIQWQLELKGALQIMGEAALFKLSSGNTRQSSHWFFSISQHSLTPKHMTALELDLGQMKVWDKTGQLVHLLSHPSCLSSLSWWTRRNVPQASLNAVKSKRSPFHEVFEHSVCFTTIHSSNKKWKLP